MQGHGTVLEQPATERSSAQDIHVGRRVAFVASDLTVDDVEELKQQGLTLMERDEDGYSVFVLNHESHTAAEEEIVDEEMAGEASTDSEDRENEDEDEEDQDPEEEDEDEDEDEEERDGSGQDYKGRTIPNNADFREFQVHGTSTSPGRKLKIDCELDVMTTCDRKDPTVVKHYLKLEYLGLHLPNYVDTDEQKGHFVYCIIVSAKPTDEWRPKIDRMFAEPSDDSHPSILTFQESSGKNVGGSITSTGGVEGQASYTTSKGRSYSETEYGWSRAEVDDYRTDENGNVPSWSVKWTWNLKHWKGGRQVFNQEKPWKFSTPFKMSKPSEYFTNPLPELPYFANLNLTNLEENKAEWRSSPEIEGKNIEWDVEVQLFTAKLQKREWSLATGLKRSYEAEKLNSRQITRITKRVTVRD